MEKLSNLKKSLPIQVAKYTIRQGIQYKPALNWWVHQVLKKKDWIISNVKWDSAYYLTNTHIFGLELPKMVEKAVTINEKNRNTLWQDKIQKEMENVNVTF